MSTIEDRLSALESEVQIVKVQLANLSRPRAWLDAVAGSMDAWPEFDEVLRLGQDFRQSMNDLPEADAHGE